MDYLPKQAVSEALHSATRGRSYVVDVQRIRNARAIGYVTKYLTKQISNAEQGTRLEHREIVGVEEDDEGRPQVQRQVCTVEVKSRARRICYSRQFFPDSVAALRKHLLDGHEQEGGEDQEEEEASGSQWALIERDPLTHDRQVYQERKQQALREVLEDRRSRGVRLSRRVLTVWEYQERMRGRSEAHAE